MAKSKTKQNPKIRVGSRKSVPRKKVPNAAKKKRPAAASSKAKPQTKADRILALLKAPEGATLKAIISVTGWQAHSVRGFISGHLVKKLGLPVKSLRRDGQRVYAVAGSKSAQ